MRKNGDSNGNIETLRRRQAAVKSALAAALVKQQKAKAKLQAREFTEVGRALCMYAEQSPEFRTMLQQVLPVAVAAVSDEASRKFLGGRGWL
jgi:hypothetical protein